jgi:protein SCO1
VLASVACFAAAAHADPYVEGGVPTRMEAAPKRLKGVDVEEHLESFLPRDLVFRDSTGRTLTLAELAHPDRPTLFSLNYSNCPMLCSLQLNGLVAALKKLDWEPGREFDLVTVSLDPTETPERAAETRARFLQDYGRIDRGGWHFLTGEKAAIEGIADALGVRYAYNEERKEYIHPAVLVAATPDGRISRYLYGIEYHPKTLRLSLVEASQGKIGSSIDRFILYCFHYDATEGRYAPVAMNIMRVAGGATAAVLGGFLGTFWLRQARRRTREGLVT